MPRQVCRSAGFGPVSAPPGPGAGPALGPAEIDRIFRPFERLTDRTSHDGFGLGLAIVASIAAVHGGTATALPRNDGGLPVTVTIPSAVAEGHGTGTPSSDTAAK